MNYDEQNTGGQRPGGGSDPNAGLGPGIGLNRGPRPNPNAGGPIPNPGPTQNAGPNPNRGPHQNPGPRSNSGAGQGPAYPPPYGAAPGGPTPYTATAMGPAPFVPPRRKAGWKRGLFVFGVILAALACMVLVVLFLFKGTGNLNQFNSPAKDYLARISIVGEIGNFGDAYSSSDQSYHHAWTLGTIDNLIGDEYNKGLLLYVNSPGGGVYESDELYLKIEEYKEKTQRPVYVYMGSMAASGGYYISAPAKTIYANRNTWTGSIGVIIGTLFDVSGFLKEHGIKATDITSGKNKGMGGNFTPMTAEQRAIFQSLVDDAYEQFVGIVADGRHMTAAQVKKIADGRIYTAKQAVENGLIDKIALEKEAIALIRTELGDENMYVDDLVYQAESDIFNFSLMDAISLRSGLLQWLGVDSGQDTAGSTAQDGLSGDVAAVLELTQEESRVPIKYLYQ